MNHRTIVSLLIALALLVSALPAQAEQLSPEAVPDPFTKASPGNGAIDQPKTLTLTWGSSVNATSYEYCVDTNDNSLCDNLWNSVGTNTSVVVYLDYLTTYFWQVRAWNSSGSTEADGGTWGSFTTQGPLPGAFNKNNPTNYAYWQPRDLTLSWLASPFATSYEYCIDTSDNNACDTPWTSVGNNTSVGLVNLIDGVTYYWQARASNSQGMIEADNGAWWRFTVDTLPPVAFFKVKPLNIAIDQVTGPILEWTRSVNAASYEFCITKNANVGCDTVWIDVGTNISTTLNGLNYNTTYQWQVRARNPSGLTEANGGKWWSFHTINTTVLKKLSPANNTIVSNGVLLEWTPLNGARYYEFCIDSKRNSKCDKKWVNVGSKTQVYFDGFKPGMNYYWQVRARTARKKVNADGGVWWRLHAWP